MSGEQIGAAIIAIVVLVFFFPRLKSMVENSPKAKEGDWISFILPIAAVIGFVILLIMMVQ